MQLLKTDNKVWCFQLFGSPHGLWLLLPVPHGLVMFSLSPESFWKSTSVFSAVREADLIHGGLSYTCARAAQEILNQQQTHPSSRVCVIPSSFHVAYASVGTFALPLRSNRVLSPVFSTSVAFSLLSVGKKGKKKYCMNTSECTNYVQTSNFSKGAEASFIFLLFYFLCMNSIEQQELK